MIVATIIEKCSRIRENDRDFEAASFAEITDEGMCMLSKAMEKNTTVVEILLYYPLLSVKGAESLASLIQCSRSLKRLRILNNEFKSAIPLRLFRAVSSPVSRLEQLEVLYNSIDEDATAELVNMLRHNTTLTRLSLASDRLSDTSAIMLSDALKDNETLQFLDLSRNCIRTGGLIKLVEALKMNNTLRTLILKGNSLPDLEGVLAVGTFLPMMKGLMHLEISAPRMTCLCQPTSVLAPLVKGMQLNPSLRHLDYGLSHSCKDEEAVAVYKNLLQYYLGDFHKEVLKAIQTGRLSLSLWPYVLERVAAKCDNAGPLFFYLLQNPLLFPRNSVKDQQGFPLSA